MKKIIVKEPKTLIKSDRNKKKMLYEVYLNNKFMKFENKKKAFEYVAKSNIKLNKKVHALNFKLIEVFKMYRLAWFYFIDENKRLNNIALEHKIKNEIESAQDMLNRLIHNTKGPNGNSFIFTFLKNAANNLLNASKLLLTVYNKRNEAVNKYTLENIILEI